MESWEEFDIDDSDLPSLARPPLTKPLLPSKRPHLSTTLKPCSQFRLPSQSTPQPQTLVSQSQQIPKESESAPSKTSKPFTIPGPAGVVQSAMHRKAGIDQIRRHDFSSTQEFLVRAIQEDENMEDEDFKKNPWICAENFVRNERLGQNNSTLGAIMNLGSGIDRVPQVVAIVTSCTPNGLGDLIVTLKDPTGTIGANIHCKVLSEFGKDISVGSVLILQKVAVFSPSRSVHYLNITLKNVIKVIRKDSGPSLSNSYLVHKDSGPPLSNSYRVHRDSGHLLSNSYPASLVRAAPFSTGTTTTTTTTTNPSSVRFGTVEISTNGPVDKGGFSNRNRPVNGERQPNLQNLFAGKFSRTTTTTISDQHTAIEAETAMEVEPLVIRDPIPNPTCHTTEICVEAQRELNKEAQDEGGKPQSLNCSRDADKETPETILKALIPDWTDEQLDMLSASLDEEW